jgi:hypothetical protein
MRLTLELVDFSNKSAKNPDNKAGDKTVSFLQKTFAIATKICGKDMSSLGLHPAVYVYSHATGKHQPSAFMAVAKWIQELEASNLLAQFCAIRKDFEDFLIKNESVSREIVSIRGSRNRAVPTLVNYYQFLLNRFLDALSSDEVMKKLEEDSGLKGFVASARRGRGLSN